MDAASTLPDAIARPHARVASGLRTIDPIGGGTRCGEGEWAIWASSGTGMAHGVGIA